MNASDRNQARAAREALADLRARDVALNAKRIATQAVVGVPERGAPVEVDPAAFTARLPAEWRDLVPATSSPHAALARAIGNAKKGIKDDGGATWMWRKIGTDTLDVLVYALIAQTTNADLREWDGKVRVTLTVAKDGAGGLKVEGLPAKPTRAIVEELDRVSRRYAKERAKLTQSDIRDVVNGVLLGKLCGVRLGGSTSFVLPKPHDERLFDLAPALDLAGVDVVATEVFADAGRRMTPTVQRGLLEECRRLKDDADGVLADLAAGKDVHATTVLDRMERLRALLAKSAGFEALLEIQLDDLRERAAEVRSLLKGAVAAAVRSA